MILCSVRSHVLITPCRVNMGFLREAELSYQENSSCFNIGPCSRFEQLQHIQQEYIRDLRVASGRLETLQNDKLRILLSTTDHNTHTHRALFNWWTSIRTTVLFLPHTVLAVIHTRFVRPHALEAVATLETVLLFLPSRPFLHWQLGAVGAVNVAEPTPSTPGTKSRSCPSWSGADNFKKEPLCADEVCRGLKCLTWIHFEHLIPHSSYRHETVYIMS